MSACDSATPIQVCRKSAKLAPRYRQLHIFNMASNAKSCHYLITTHNVRHGLQLVCYSNFVLCFSDIRLPKIFTILPSPFDRAPLLRSIVTMTLSCAVSEILNVKKYCDLEITENGQSRS